MSLQNRLDLEVTRVKLRLLEDRFDTHVREQDGDRHVREISMRSLRRLINQLKEEIVRFESQNAMKANAG